MMVIGYILKRIRWMSDETTNSLNKLVFKVFLPALLFMDLAKEDFVDLWDNTFVIFCALATIISILICYLLSFLGRKEDRGEFIQASFRSAAATLGIAFMTNIYSSAAMVALMIIGSVPIYNTVAVIVLCLFAPNDTNTNDTKSLIKRTIKNVVTNPIILSIFAGLIWSICKIPQPAIMVRSLTYLGNVASPVALITLGASFEFSDLKENLTAIIAINFNKLILFGMLFLPVGIYLGFRNEKLVAALIMLCSATTSSSFIMSKNMGHRGVISSSAVMTTTLFSSFTLTLWLFILRSLGYI